MNTDRVIGMTGLDRGFAVSLLERRSVSFAIEEDKLRRFKGLGFAALRETGSRALDMAVSKIPGGIVGVDSIAYVPPIDAGETDIEETCAIIADRLRRRYGGSPPVASVDHIAAHLAFERAVHGVDRVLMLGQSRVVYSAGLDRPHDTDAPSDVAALVPRLAGYLGIGMTQAHHLENMAQRGEPRFLDDLEALEGLTGPVSEALLGEIERITGAARLLYGRPPTRVHFDFAASVHALLRKRILSLLHSVPGDWRGQTLALCGGVCQSWSLNDAIAAEFPDTRFRVSFAPGNAACAVGGALAQAGIRPETPVGPFLGPEYSPDEIKSVLDNSKAKYAFASLRETIPVVCRALEEGKMVGWFTGRCEFGYRALGARSVFANPAAPYACENLSAFLKLRPDYFAYAVAVPEDRPEVQGVDSPYLSRSIRLPQYFDDSVVRVQTVSKASTPLLYQLLGAFRERTGIPALLNTSLNYFDEPIACTPRDALKTFGASGLDVLVLDGFLLRKG